MVRSEKITSLAEVVTNNNCHTEQTVIKALVHNYENFTVD